MTDPRQRRGAEGRRRHFILEAVTHTEPFRSPTRGSSPTIPRRDREQHGNALLQQVRELAQRLPIPAGVEDATDISGTQIEFQGFPGLELAFESIPRERSGIELLNVRQVGEITYATAYVPEGKLGHFEAIIQNYLAERRGANNQALDHRVFVDTISDIRAASLRALWTDDEAAFPADLDRPFWWEIWLPIRGDREAMVRAFHELAAAQQVRTAPGILAFPERTVLLAFGSPRQLTRSMALINLIAEIRSAKETAEFFDALPVEEQRQWGDDLLARVTMPNEGEQVPHVCLLDTGVNRGHDLIQPALSAADMHTVDPAWGVDDHLGHGTELAGLALLGDLTDVLPAAEPIRLGHRLESVKLLYEHGGNVGDARLHGLLTVEAVARPEVSRPGRARVFNLAITSRDNRDRGRPSAWSAAVDALAADVVGEGETPRLLVVAAGNVVDANAWGTYPDSNTSDSIHDPAQAWNALTVGAATELTNIMEPYSSGHHPIARPGGLSPFSTTSGVWDAQWPLKPDIVLEGGNAGNDGVGAVSMPSLSLLTTSHTPLERVFTTTCATSAATALASRMAAELMATYPTLRPETIRALMVHSARWTGEMRRMYLPLNPSKRDFVQLVRHCGFGVPSLERARWSVSNALVMIVEAELHPFTRSGNKEPTLRDMHVHSLPWPLPELEGLGDTMVEMRVTLSYFIEPNPSARGTRSRYRYESHGLRFDVKRPAESQEEFRRRVNRAARDEEEGTRVRSDDAGWSLGTQARHRGSLHADVWRGTAADLASRGSLAVYPALGWWKTRTKLARYDQGAAYSLVVSIHAPEVDVDLYGAVEARIASRVGVET